MRFLVTVAALWCCALPNVLAQSADWVVLPTTTDDEVSWMQPTVDELGRELRKQGVRVWSPSRTIARLQQRGPTPPAIVSEAAIEAWAGRADGALRQLASGDYEGAIRELGAAQAFSRKALETLNRDPTHARRVLDTCLYLVRSFSETGNEERARIQARECVWGGLSSTPTPYMHPPTVLGLYEDAAKPGPARSGNLLVESEPSSCPVRVNGSELGETPLELTGLYPGEYRVQVECDPKLMGRVHTVAVPPGDASLFVFDQFDQAVRSTPVLHLGYDDQPSGQRLVRDARELATALPASMVVVASMSAKDTLDLRLVSRTQTESAFAKVVATSSGPRTSAIVGAATALLARRCGDFTGPKPVMIDCETGEVVQVVEPKHRRPPQGQFVSGVTMASLGTASLLAGYGLLIVRQGAGNDWNADPNSLDAQEKWLKLGTGLTVTGAAGSALLVAAMPLALPYKAKTPWWAWLSGGLGVVAVALSVTSVAIADPKPSEPCSINGPEPGPCVSRARQTDRAILLGMTAAPLLTVPLVYLFRKPEKKLDVALAPSISASRRGGSLGLRGIF